MSLQTHGTHDKKGRLVQPIYLDGRTKQAFKDETDIVKMLSRAQKAGTMSHLQKYEGQYGDFADFDFLQSTLMLTKGREVFDALPSELRREFNQSPADFFDYVNDPANAEDLAKKLPMLAKPGRQNIDASGKTPPESKSEPDPENKAGGETSTPPPAEKETEPPGGSSFPPVP